MCVCNVLALLGEGEAAARATLQAAVDLAERSNARLTLAKTCEAGRAYVWIAPFAVGAAYLPPEVDSPELAGQELSRLAAAVPDELPVTTVVLTGDPQTGALKLLTEGRYGAVVAEAADLARWRRLRRHLRRGTSSIVVVNCDAEPSGVISIERISSNEPTEDGGVDANQSDTRRRGPRSGLRPWLGGRVAGAGGEH